jgi:hypothetical protein
VGQFKAEQLSMSIDGQTGQFPMVTYGKVIFFRLVSVLLHCWMFVYVAQTRLSKVRCVCKVGRPAITFDIPYPLYRGK